MLMGRKMIVLYDLKVVDRAVMSVRIFYSYSEPVLCRINIKYILQNVRNAPGEYI